MPHTATATAALERLKHEPNLPQSPHFLPFAALFCGHFPPDELPHLSGVEAAGLTTSLWELFETRTADTPTIRLRSPRLESLPWADDFAVIEILNPDKPFLVDSITLEINRHGVPVHLVVHPVLLVSRDAAGKMMAIHGSKGQDAPSTAKAESVMHIRIPAIADSALAERLTSGLERVLNDVSAAVSDWHTMQATAKGIAAHLEGSSLAVSRDTREESLLFIRWLLENNFTFLGYRHLTYSGANDALISEISAERGLGILRNSTRPVFDGTREVQALPADIQDFLMQPRLIHFSKSHTPATVHRNVAMDVISIKDLDATGNLRGEHRFVGLFTSQAYHSSARNIPLIRRKVDDVLTQAGFDPQGHDGKALLHILQTFPRDELYQASSDDLLEIGLGILYLQERQRVALFLRRDAFGRYVSCFVYVPRDRYNTQLRQKIQRILEARLSGKTRDYQAHVEQSPLARLYFVISTDAQSSGLFDKEAIEQELQDASRNWTDSLKHRLFSSAGSGGDAGRLASQYASGAFPQLYQDRYPVEEAIADMMVIEQGQESRTPDVRLYAATEASTSNFQVKVYTPRTALSLSDILPILENMGLKALSEETYAVKPAMGETVWVHDFAVCAASGKTVDLTQTADRFRTALLGVLAGELENDALNALVLASPLTARQIVIFRTYARYAAQIGFAYNFQTVADTLSTHSDAAILLADLFAARFEIAFTGDRTQTQATRNAALQQYLQKVTSVAEDRILSVLAQLIQATLRTNFYKGGDSPLPYVSIKLKSGEVPDLPLPRPDTEMFVYAPFMESIHLRGGKVARGGIRWSDRKDDYRTEVLGLVKAQMVKNAVIVPVGSKGGFICKKLPDGSDRAALQQEVVRCYQTMMRGMLDITDTLDGTTVKPPLNVVRQDGDDPYLVVAADKGTATFSDIANGIALEYGFWLGDAFASGGSAGYDHKKMGITARGGWEAVKRHFRETGKDIQAQDFTVIGVGDMAGDVFGNGMLLSKHIKLIAAFNHKHIFLDPTPDAARSFAERERLFHLPTSQWTDYDTNALSKGGRIYDRASKQCDLTPEIRDLLGIDSAQIAPSDLMKTLLKHPAELLWFGGIGTFVRSSDESNADVGDKANDGLRIAASDLKATVIGEGANLGMTQKARIEYALNGGRLNTDAIDNSAGVDTSDHEVNIKILLRLAASENRLTLGEREPLLAQMTDEVAHLVLRNNYLQTLALSLAQSQGAALLHPYIRLMKTLEKAGRLNPALEFLPTEKTLSTRFQQGQALTRPELAVLMAYAKLQLFDEVVHSNLPDEPHMLTLAKNYFPKVLQEKFGDLIERHPLRREIIATHTANSIVNRLGAHFVNEIQLATGRKVCDIARAYSIVRDSFALRPLWTRIEELDGAVHADVQLEMLSVIGGMVQHLVLWLLRNAPTLEVTPMVAEMLPKVQHLKQVLPEALTLYRREKIASHVSSLVEKGVPADLAEQVAYCRPLASAGDILRISDTLKSPVQEAGAMYFQVSYRFGCHWLRDAVRAVPVQSSWQQQALAAVVNDVYDAHAALAAHILTATTGEKGDSAARIEAWTAQQPEPIHRYDALLAEVKAQSSLDVSMAVVTARMLAGLSG